ncbi:MAG: AAA family ATPase [Alphaproteobacteria bacterium]|nr:AAA family ATPase [Alphaproteobacteria bacterium]
MVVEDQSEVAAFLADPRTWGVDRVERIDTHGAMVFLAGDRAYKLKRAVKFPFMDFSTLALRERACAAELRVNRRTAPQLYLGTARVTREGEGLAIDGPGPAVDWIVVMQRFDQERLLDRIAARGALDDALAERVACAVAAFHASVERCEGFGRSADIVALIADVGANMAAQPALDEGARAALIAACSQAFRDAGALIDSRQRAGFVRWCHGDLHLRNICVLEGGPTLFDAIEFNDSFCCTDTLYDLAFLVSDLCRIALRPAANRVLNRYLEETGDWDGVPLLPLFLALRAGILAYTLAASAQAQRDPARTEALAADARRCLALGRQFLAPQAGRIVAIGGLSGSGKSTAARALAPALGRIPGAVILRSDVLRKRRAGVAPTTPLGPEHYGPGSSEAVYRELRERASVLARAGQAVVVDAVFARAAERDMLADAARASGVAFAGFWLDVAPAVAAARVAARRGDASDATVAVVEQQRGYDLGRIDWTRIDAAPGAVAVTETLRRALA